MVDLCGENIFEEGLKFSESSSQRRCDESAASGTTASAKIGNVCQVEEESERRSGQGKKGER